MDNSIKNFETNLVADKSLDIEPKQESHIEDLIGSKAVQLISPQDVDVNIRCTIGNVNMNIDELLKLKIGDVIDFCRWPATVKLSVNNRFFAEGILVEIEGFLGVKITKRLQHFS